mmetsp:Transcript_115715/g.327230  ORF Transcript_115715/g.327230 Transcript_115715/m.327230 type:complete len:219 (+) Transcript_115715:303-959(+)
MAQKRPSSSSSRTCHRSHASPVLPRVATSNAPLPPTASSDSLPLLTATLRTKASGTSLCTPLKDSENLVTRWSRLISTGKWPTLSTNSWQETPLTSSVMNARTAEVAASPPSQFHASAAAGTTNARATEPWRPDPWQWAVARADGTGAGSRSKLGVFAPSQRPPSSRGAAHEAALVVEDAQHTVNAPLMVWLRLDASPDVFCAPRRICWCSMSTSVRP